MNELRLTREHNERAEKQVARLNEEVTEWRMKWERAELEKTNLKSQFDLQINEKIAMEIKIARDQAE